MSEVVLPNGWKMSSIGALCYLNNGRAFKPAEWGIQGLPIVRIQNLNKFSAKFNYYNGDFQEQYHLKGGELLFAWSGTPGTSFGAHVWRGGEALLNQHIFRVDFDVNFFDKRFFRYAINQTLNELIDIAHGGVGLRHVTKGKFEETQIIVPPLSEQKRIADKLDVMLVRIDTCQMRLSSVQRILKRFRQSVLTAATSGQLTPEFRSSNVDVDTEIFPYPLVPFEKLVFSVRGGSNAVPSNEPTDFPILRSSSVRQGVLNLLDVKFLTSQQSKRDSNFIENEDVLFTRLNGSAEYVGNCAVVTDVPKNTYQYPDRLFCAKLKASLEPEYCMYAFSTPSVRLEIERRAKSTAGHKRISIQDLKEIEIRLPSIAEQQAIVLRVKTLFAFADRLEARLATACTAVDRLTPALLAKAFRGELVPQDPADEPASELLARLTASREAETAKPRRTRTAKA
jgi:type I restriction enzyme S subunit